MKDAKGHGSEAHSSGVEKIGQTVAPGSSSKTFATRFPLNADGTVQAWHGTTRANADALKSGAGRPPGANWRGAESFGERGNATFVANNPKQAEYYAGAAVRSQGSGSPAVVELRIPRNEFTSSKFKDDDFDVGSAYTTGGVKPEWVKR